MKDLSTLPMDSEIRIKDVLRIVPLSKSTWYNGVRKGEMPQPANLTEGTSSWRLGDILEWNRKRRKETAKSAE